MYIAHQVMNSKPIESLLNSLAVAARQLNIILVLFSYKAHIPNIHALNSDTHTLFLSKLNSKCVGVANEVIGICYMGVIRLARGWHDK